MTNEELAQHWNVPLSEVQSIADYMNNLFTLHVGKNRKDGLYYGLMYRNDEKHGPMLAVSSKQGYKTPKEAADFLNEACDIMQMPDMRAELMGVPADAYKTLKKIDVSVYATKTQSLNNSKVFRGRE